MNFKSKKARPTILWSVVVLLMVTGGMSLVYSFAGGQSDANENLTDIDAIYTNAMSTVNAQQSTMQASVGTATLAASTSSTATFASIGGTATFSTSTLAVSTSICDSSVYIADVTIPDGASVSAGQSFAKTWKVSNTGTCTWSATYQIIFISGDGMSGKATQIGKVVKPGESVEVSVTLIAPSTTGTIKGTWRLSNDKSQPFGDVLTVEIKVGTGATATPTKGAYPNP